MTTDSSISVLRQPGELDDPLTTVLREGVLRLLAEAIQAEAEVFLQSMREERLADGGARFVRHGHGPERQIQGIGQTGIGEVPVQRVKVGDRSATADGSADERLEFTSAILPKWARRTASLPDLGPGCAAAGSLERISISWNTQRFGCSLGTRSVGRDR